MSRQTTARELARRVRRVISMPEVYLQIRTLVSDPESSLSDVASVIAHEPGLTAQLLRLVNSAFFGFPSRVDTVSRAVSILGTQRIHDIVLAASVTRAFAGIDARVMSMEAYWQRSVHCGVIAWLLATRCGVLESERLFVAGLLCDVGHLVLYQELPQLAAEALARSRAAGEPIHRVERELLGFDYAEVGGALLAEWALPGSLEEAVGRHLEPHLAGAYPLEASLVHLASRSLEACLDGVEPGRALAAVSPFAWERTDLDPEAVTQVLGEAEDRVQGIVQLFLPDAGGSSALRDATGSPGNRGSSRLRRAST